MHQRILFSGNIIRRPCFQLPLLNEAQVNIWKSKFNLVKLLYLLLISDLSSDILNGFHVSLIFWEASKGCYKGPLLQRGSKFLWILEEWIWELLFIFSIFSWKISVSWLKWSFPVGFIELIHSQLELIIVLISVQ